MADNNSTTNIGKGLTAGLAATVALLILMILKAQVGLMPGLDIPKMLAGLAGAPGQPLVGWAVHLVIGIVLYGIAIATLDDRLPGDGSLMHGLVLAVVGWLIMMLVLLPLAGAGLFGMNMGIMAAVMTLILHLIFGAVLGWTYGRLMRRDPILATDGSATVHSGIPASK